MPVDTERVQARGKQRFVWENVLGGTAVLGSYAHGLATHPATRGDVWGGVPEALQPVYTVCMLLAAAGYFPMTAFLLLRVDPLRARVAGRFGFGFFELCYALVLVGSALWMPLTFRLLEAPSTALWWLIRADLLLVGAGALGILGGLLALQPREPAGLHRLAVLGCCFFCVQTALLDALVWPAFFPI